MVGNNPKILRRLDVEINASLLTPMVLGKALISLFVLFVISVGLQYLKNNYPTQMLDRALLFFGLAVIWTISGFVTKILGVEKEWMIYVSYSLIGIVSYLISSDTAKITIKAVSYLTAILIVVLSVTYGGLNFTYTVSCFVGGLIVAPFIRFLLGSLFPPSSSRE